MTLTDDILDIIAQKALLDRSKLTPQAKLADLSVSSFDMIEVMFALEDKYGIDLPFNANTNAGSFSTMGDVIAFVEKQIAAKPSAAVNG